VGVFAPGRVNLIGEHIDYNGGSVMPIAIPAYTVIVGARRKDDETECQIYSTNMTPPNNVVKIDTKQPITPIEHPQVLKWSNYVRGVMALFPSSYPAFDALITSNVPIGGGLSSSASVEVATLKFLQCLTPENRYISLKDQALLCQEAEHKFAGCPCGIMDQFVVLHAKEGRALLIDCETYTGEHLPFDNPDVVVVVTNSNVKHELSGSEYSKRRADCFAAAKTLGIESLRDASLDMLTEHEKDLDATVFRRARHVVTEIDRVAKAVDALQKHDYARFGQLMNESHFSLRDDFEVSCSELDQLAAIAQKCEGVFGSRMTGGGFGGCTVTLVKKECVDNLVAEIQKNYTLGKPTFYICYPGNGAGRLPLA